MSDLLNKYIEQHDEFINALIQYHSAHIDYVERQSPSRTIQLRKVLKKMRSTIIAMQKISQQRKKERQVEWGKVNRVKKEKEDE